MMDDEDEDCTCDDQEVEVTAERFLLIDVACIGVRWTANVASEVSGALHGVANMLVRHSTWVREREAFAIGATCEIEMLTGPDR